MVAAAWMLTITTSVAAMVLLVSVNDTLVVAASAAAVRVMRPATVLSVTAVDLSVACVTAPPAPVA